MKKLFTMLALVLAFAVTGCATAEQDIEHGLHEAAEVADTAAAVAPHVIATVEAFKNGDVNSGLAHLLQLTPDVEHDIDAIKAGLRSWATKPDSTEDN